MLDLLTRLRLVLRVLCGKAVMYRVKVQGTAVFYAGQDTAIVECEFVGAP